MQSAGSDSSAILPVWAVCQSGGADFCFLLEHFPDRKGEQMTRRSAHSLGSSDGNGDDVDGADDVGDNVDHLNGCFWVLKTFPLLFLFTPQKINRDGYDYSHFFLS